MTELAQIESRYADMLIRYVLDPIHIIDARRLSHWAFDLFWRLILFLSASALSRALTHSQKSPDTTCAYTSYAPFPRYD